jgi:hypothetical protein
MKKYEVSDITEPVYKSVVTIIVHCSCEELNTWLAQYRHETEKPVEDAYQDCLGLAFSHKNKDGAQWWVIWVKEFNWTIQCMGVLVHELPHLTFMISSTPSFFLTQN